MLKLAIIIVLWIIGIVFFYGMVRISKVKSRKKD